MLILEKGKVSATAILCCVACGGDGKPSQHSSNRSQGSVTSDASLGSVSDAGMGPSPIQKPLEKPRAGKGFQLRPKDAPVGPESDQQWCEVMELPRDLGETLYISAMEFQLGPYSHHGHVMAVEAGTEADRLTKVGDVQPCTGNGGQPYGHGLAPLVSASGLLSKEKFPAGVGLVVRAGQKVVVNLHTANFSEKEVVSTARINFETTDKAHVKKEIQRFGWYNLGVAVGPRSKVFFGMQCTVSQDIDVHTLIRHTHSLGTTFDVSFSGGLRDGERLFESTSWDHGTEYAYAPALRLKKGEGLRFKCNFDNPGSRTVSWGELGTDEMCILYGRWTTAEQGVSPVSQNCVSYQSPPGEVSIGFPCAECP